MLFVIQTLQENERFSLIEHSQSSSLAASLAEELEPPTSRMRAFHRVYSRFCVFY